MVIRARLLLGGLLLAASGVLAAAPPSPAAAQWQLNRERLALGEALQVRITAPAAALTAADLTPLTRDFDIQHRSLSEHNGSATLQLSLHPLRTGRIALPVLGLPGTPPSVAVTDGADNVPTVRWQVSTDPAHFYVRQPVRLSLEACASSGLNWKRPDVPVREGLILRPMGEERLDSHNAEGHPCQAQRWHWAVVPTAAGRQRLPLPMIEAARFGESLRYPPPEVLLDTRPVPIWLPAEAAVGAPPLLQAEPLPAEWPIERPLGWRVTVQGGYSLDGLKSLLALHTAPLPVLGAYPPSVELLPGDSAVPRYAIRLHLLSPQGGEQQLPALRFPWFDPVSGELRHAALPGATLRFYNPLWPRLAQGLGLLVLAAAGTAAIWRLALALAWRLRRRRALAALAAAPDPGSLAHVVRGYSLRPDAGDPAISLHAWLARMHTEARGPSPAPLVRDLEAACYATPAAISPAALDKLRAAARTCLAAQRPTTPAHGWRRKRGTVRR
jgi:hypothetical protein